MSSAVHESLDQYAALASPDPTCTPGLLASIAGDHLDATTELLLVHADDHIRQMGVAIQPALEQAVLLGRKNFEVCWSPGTGFCIDALHARTPCMLPRGIALTLLHAAMHGSRGCWHLRLAQPTPLFVDNILLPTCATLDVESSDAAITVKVSGCGSPMELLIERQAAAHGCRVSDSLTMPTARYADATLVVLPRAAISSIGTAHNVLPAASSEHIEALTAALQLLYEAAPRYFQWVGWVMRRVALTHASPGAMNSSTIDGHSGLCLMSASLQPLDLAEMLVHESSHQYYHIATSVGQLADPHHVQQYYSPFPRQMRALSRLLLAYHAFANVALFYGDCIASGICPRSKLSQGSFFSDLLQTESVLREQQDHLTPLGQHLFKTLLTKREAL